ncbi:hypothetical protein [Lutispora saccharofermentans]|uniref:Uncharacterized protein n=1 Tax=Lutispora saccharofermentans TaxID=3024236 RepID=A0ABT1NKP9_9FIRM|nr:hypothetical protein [Lutispora saccharofermentans]MCQ1531776.1 hypothetical protein [Lutispora saccharofermentans]
MTKRRVELRFFNGHLKALKLAGQSCTFQAAAETLKNMIYGTNIDKELFTRYNIFVT